MSVRKTSQLKKDKSTTNEVNINKKKLNKACVRALAALLKSCERLKQ